MTVSQCDTASVSLEVSYIINIIINSITSPFTVLLNVLVIKIVMKIPRLRTNSNILLACLAVSDALTGLFGQPSYVLWRIFLIFGLSSSEIIENLHFNVMSLFSIASCLHLTLVTFERLIAIKFAMRYSNIITDNNLKVAVILIWIIAFLCSIFTVLKMNLVSYSIGILVTISCIVFVAFAYGILYRESCRHQRQIKAQQLPLEVERFTRENKALKTTVFVVGAVTVCILPADLYSIVCVTGVYDIFPINEALWQTCGMLNSLVNPLIYCWRQKDMRKLVFRVKKQVIHPSMN